MVFDETIKFYGKYRPYQQRVLDNLSAFLDNEKIHIVAAPGSGKTILGIQLIIEINQPSLILVPSIAIREQWIERFARCFLSNPELKDNWISTDIKVQKPIICITYQALYSAYKKEKIEIEDEEEEIEEENFDDFELFETLKKYNIKTYCLDECHHLKTEWWKALEAITKQIEDMKIIALTATPPYDSSFSDWKRYIDLCGPIDEEIFVPELIKDNNLCPHHDYIYFSYPTKDEEVKALKYYSNGIKTYHKYKNNPELLDIVLSNKIYKDVKAFKRAFYNNEEYYRSLILYLNENKIKIPFAIRNQVHIRKLTINDLETLLQNVMFDDQGSYKKNDLIFSMKKEFSALGIVHNREVHLVHDERINKIISLSASKLESIKEIVRNENSAPNKQMKCLVLTDYIKLKTKSYIGNEDAEITTLGAVPIFEYLRRANIENVKLCCLSGTICIVPMECKEELDDQFEFSKLNNEYVEVKVTSTNRKKMVLAITSLFEQGKFNVLIGTKALLGEGWDSPCINTLIMASFIGSYVSSNQMRGRAIRVDKKNPNKIANIWHLVCLDPYDYKFSYDYYTLQKRFSTFIGIDKRQKSIESGIDRLEYDRMPYNSYEASIVNKNTIESSKDNQRTKEVWEECINKAKQLAYLTKITAVSRKRLKKDFSFYAALTNLLLYFGLLFADYGLYTQIIKLMNKYVAIALCAAVAVFCGHYFATSVVRFFGLLNQELKLHTLGVATLRALKKEKIVTSKNIRICVYHKKGNYSAIYLKNATTYEQNIFSECISQILGEVRQPRYLLAKPRKVFSVEYYVVPDVFKKNKDLAKSFEKEMERFMGKFALIFAKNDQGRNIVLRAQRLNYFKYKKVDIHTKNVLLSSRKELKKDINI